MHFLFSRHGNTFEANQPAVWVGAENDLPLVAVGREQALLLAKSLEQRGVLPKRIFAAPLLRTREYAEIVAEKLGLSAAISMEPRLMELDYGSWSGLTSEEIEKRLGKSVLEDWELRSTWPKNCGWGSSEKEVLGELQALILECRKELETNDTALFVTSNGRLRFLLKLVPGEFECRVGTGSFKVKTGNVCLFEDAAGHLTLRQWNVPPTALTLKA